MANISESAEEVAAEARRSGGTPEYRPIWEVIDEIMSRVPAAVLERLPTDGAERHDQYLYGTRSKERQES
jgi:hypothetical protein